METYMSSLSLFVLCNTTYNLGSHTTFQEKVEDAALLSLIRKLPFNVAAPNQALLEELEVLSKLGLDFPPDIRHAGILSFATLLHKAMEISQVKQDYFDNIVVKYFRMYSDCPQYLDRMIWLQGLCNIGYSAESYTRIIHADSTRDRHERLWAALAGSPKTEESYTVLETTVPIITNETEHIQLRIIALHSFLSSSNVRETDFMFIHNYIRNCHNNQLKRFWFATMKNLEANKNFSGYRVTKKEKHLFYTLNKRCLPRWSSGRKCDCRPRGLWFDSRIGQIGVWNCVQYLYGNRLTPYYMGLKTEMVKKVCVHCIAASRVVMSTSAYPFGDKRRYFAPAAV
uniref:SFRICE_022994 n=1 Tax=Spodoptera frugiperda TaxID=7108 RepID=A0A2H1V365_SPOFR